MIKLQNEYDIWAEDDLFEDLEVNSEFKEFVGKCISHFLHFVIPRRNQTEEILQDYEIPEMDDILQSSVMLKRKTDGKEIIGYSVWRD